jgi:hypothetical protein
MVSGESPALKEYTTESSEMRVPDGVNEVFLIYSHSSSIACLSGSIP